MPVRRWIWWVVKPAVFFACLTPLGLLIWRLQTGQLSANPLDDITDQTGTWTLRFLLTTLSFTPVRWITGWNDLIRFRRMLGLFAFFYGLLHLTTYVWFVQFFDFNAILEDIPKRPFITAGFTALVLMLPLALTSTKKWIGRLGGRRWQMLHRLVYFSAIAGVIHYLWLVKLDTDRPIAYAVVLGALLGIRAWRAIQPKMKGQRISTPIAR
jgi:sulfoxide reductase heme-binding subunit YedZ